ncbi:glutaredoxin family protein [Thioalkalivibrio sp. HK1]|uniref:glutaredoxin family protein n=1 Tax=Thioalkalivibrio sp. HK1 TaxID=1469245 RepID=UPI0004707712|nr:glutaredoxin family protein [Thioalkalivibrio sp. HK1]
MTTRLVVYERMGCHLCEDMVATLAEWRKELDIDIERVDVDRSAELAARYGLRVPVLVCGDAEVCHFFLDLEALREAVSEGESRKR